MDSLDYLLKVGVGKLIRKITKSDPTLKKHVCLPKVVTTSKGSIGTWLASSFYEIVNLMANQVVTKENSLLSPDEIDTLAALRVGRDFIQLMRDSYDQSPLKILQGFAKGKE